MRSQPGTCMTLPSETRQPQLAIGSIHNQIFTGRGRKLLSTSVGGNDTGRKRYSMETQWGGKEESVADLLGLEC